MYDFKEFHDVACELSQTDDEAHIRSAINRDYYSLFGESRRYLVEVKRKNYLKTKIGIHTKVCNELMRSNDPTENYVGNLLLKLKAARGYADYDWNEKNIDYFRKTLLKIQKEVPNGLESLGFLNRKYSNN